MNTQLSKEQPDIEKITARAVDQATEKQTQEFTVVKGQLEKDLQNRINKVL
jgi:hypothetical protein